MKKITSAIACNLDKNILAAALPLFEAGKVEGIEWSFDALFRRPDLPDWFAELLTEFGAAGRLVGHGVFFSLFSGKWRREQQDWLDHLRRTAAAFRFDHISEHFGFMTGADFHRGAPLPLPFNRQTLRLGQDRLARIHEACQCPVGLENLAFAYSADEVEQHGEFLERLLEPVEGFLILDLHNLFCQVKNFRLNADDLLRLHSLDRVREIHISGGSWEPSQIEPTRQIRRDTHDDAVPEEVFDLLKIAIPRCPNLRFVVMEQLPVALDTPAQQLQFRLDFLRMKKVVAAASAARYLPKGKYSTAAKRDFLPKTKPLLSAEPAEDLELWAEQLALSEILETAGGAAEARLLLEKSRLASSDWQVENWELAMLETAVRIAQKWK